jgi:hypothetical protein
VDASAIVAAANRSGNGGGATVWMPAHGLGTVVQIVGLTCGPTRFIHYQEFLKSAQICKIKTDALDCTKNFQNLHEARLEYSEQVSQLCQLQMCNKIHVKNSWTH